MDLFKYIDKSESDIGTLTKCSHSAPMSRMSSYKEGEWCVGRRSCQRYCIMFTETNLRKRYMNQLMRIEL